mgnify:CR=1 FL=1|jgi:uncharacterized protein
MSQNSSRKKGHTWRWLVALGLPAWVLLAFMTVQLIVGFVLYGLGLVGVNFEALNGAVQSTFLGGVIYLVTLLVVIGVPWLVLQKKTSLTELGLSHSIRWRDIGMAPLGFVAYIFLSAVLLVIAQQILPFVDFEQAQDVGFSGLTMQYEYILAFSMLVVIAPVAEEIIFRGYLFAKLRARLPLWIAILITSLLFGLVHFAWNVGIDTFALSIVLCLLVVWSKSLWPAILLHMLKNFIAFYFLFINPSILTTLGG